MADYGDNIRAKREELGMSQVQLADLIGETKQTVWKYESGTVKNIPLPKVEKIAKALHCTPQDITGWEIKDPVTNDGAGESIDEFQQIYVQLNEENKRSLSDYALYLLQRQNNG